MKLSILIPTLNDRRNQKLLKRLMAVLQPQLDKHPGEVEVRTYPSDRSIPTGTKRNTLIAESHGDYFCFIDDDDMVPEYYVDELLVAIKRKPHVITFIGYMTTNGANRKEFTIELGSGYFERNDHYYRYPNHLCCFKKDIVQDVKFPDLWQKEDYIWATEIKKRRLLKKEVHICRHMYHYDFVTKKHK